MGCWGAGRRRACPTGSTGCPWQKARGQRPKCVFLYLSSIALMPRGVMMKRAWIRPYSSSAADSIDSCCSSEKPAVAGLSTSRIVSSANS